MPTTSDRKWNNKLGKNFQGFSGDGVVRNKEGTRKNGGIVRENIFKANHLKFQKVLKTTL